MNEKLKDKVIEIIRKQANISKLNFEIKNENSDINIVCSKTKFDSFFVVHNEIKNIYNEINSICIPYKVKFIFEKCYIQFLNEDINIDESIRFIECTLNVEAKNSNNHLIRLVSNNFRSCGFEQISLSNRINLLHIDLESISIKILHFENIDFLNEAINKIELKDCDINEIMIKDSIFKKDFAIFSSKINTIKINNVDFEALSEFHEVTFQEKFDLSEITYKGFTLFDKCVFNTKAKLEYIIFEKFASFRGSTFNKGLNLDYSSGDKEINFFGINGLESNESKKNTSRETYRIIKYNFEKIGNKIEANKYHALELDQKRRELEKKKWQNKLDYVVFKLHDLSSEHSTNWFLALFWIFVVSYLTNIGLNNEISINCLFKYINILSSVDDFNESYVVMALNKVLLGYLYYQFVTATRKDTGK